MKPQYFDEKKTIRDILLVITIIAGFIFVVAFSAFYVADAINKGVVCGCVIPVPIMLLLLSSLGVFVGSLSYYLLSSKFIKQRREYSKNVDLTLNFLGEDEKKVVQTLLAEKRPIQQSTIQKNTGLNKVKVHRLVNRLINRGVLLKENIGKISKVSVSEDLEKLFD